MARDPQSASMRPFIQPNNRRDILADLARAPRVDVEAAIDALIASAGTDARSKKDGKDGAADGITGIAAGRFSDDDTGKEATDDTGKESTDDTGKESTDSTGKESTDSTGKESTDGTGKEATDGTGKEATDGTGKEATDGTGKEATDGTGKEGTDDTGKEATDYTGKEAGKDTADINDIIHWYNQTFNAKETKDAFDEDPKGLRDTAIESPSDFDRAIFNAGRVEDQPSSSRGPIRNLDVNALQRVEREHTSLLGDLIRPDHPII